MSNLTLDNYHLITGQRFRMLKTQKERGLTREQAFAETYGPKLQIERIAEPIHLEEKKDIPAPVKVAVVQTRDLLTEAKNLTGKLSYGRLRRELRITWQQASDLMETLRCN